MKDLHPNDLRNWTKGEAKHRLFKIEMLYLVSRGWQILCGVPLSEGYVSPIDGKIFSHEDAVTFQKQMDE
jgi:hypothetical protein